MKINLQVEQVWRYDPKHQQAAAYQHVRMRVSRLPKITDAEKRIARENRHDLSVLLMQGGSDQWERIILYFLASCPNSSWIDRGVDKSLEYLANGGRGRLINQDIISGNFLLTLYSMFRFNPGNAAPDKQVRYYYEQASFLLTLLCVVDYFAEEGVGPCDTRTFLGVA